MTTPKLKVLSVSHTAHSRGSGRLRYSPFAEQEAIQLELVVPDRWRQGGKDRPADPPSDGITMLPLPIRLPHVRGANWYAHWYSGLAKVLKEFQPDVLHLWEEPWSVVALQAAVLRGRLAPRCALVLETDQNILHRLPLPFEAIRRFTLSRTDWLIARTEECVQVCRGCGYGGGTTFVHYCVDRTTFNTDAPAGESPEPVAAKTGLRVGYVGRFIREKGLFTVLEALRLCRAPVSFQLVGGGPALAELETTAATTGIGSGVAFLGSKPAGEIAAFMKTLDVLVLMSETTATWKEQFGRVIIEAQACGVPVIGSSSGAIPEVVDRGGWIVPEGDAAALARLLDELAAAPERLAAASREALGNVEKYTPPRVAAALTTAYQAAAAQRQQTQARRT